ncbi:DEAD/DEAH box helicase [Vagococcus intermedius]|uniref:DEAD/DEAH box helicase n=1 Tax=Vagococcus intermedius TaxID=2991418 RepID=A0AAF0CVT8_9ENTE|nr:DEAD/DEAH box helicase [Vagococcus intermedius]WEG73767.1 DEAD/DEAH box helicase [Vagococcus intermedius]WEG75852.1 DEAD/DEAH box helicase [Vagococcus intermedius]
MDFKTKLPEKWQTHWDELGYTEASLIQKETYEPLLNKESLVGVSPTGTGKTLAYLFPLLQAIKPGEGNQLLILLPSQELAVQVANVAREWATLLELNVQSLIGGANVKRQIDKLKSKPEVLVGTPGRVVELCKNKKVKAHLLQTVVLDEADQLVETNELNATMTILKMLDKQAQLVCVSATAIDVQAQLGDHGQREMTTIDVSQKDQSKGIVTHGYIKTPPRKRAELLKKLAYVKDFKAIVFFNEVQEMGLVADKLSYQGVPNATLASDQNKLERRLALSAFADDKVSLLLTTDIAARGLDFVDLPFVIHYDVPYVVENYVHRSGRTGRMGKDGTVMSLVGDYELKDLKKMARQHPAMGDLVEWYVHSSQILPISERVNSQEDQSEVPHDKHDLAKGVKTRSSELSQGGFSGELKAKKKKVSKKKVKAKTKNKKAKIKKKQD